MVSRITGDLLLNVGTCTYDTRYRGGYCCTPLTVINLRCHYSLSTLHPAKSYHDERKRLQLIEGLKIEAPEYLSCLRRGHRLIRVVAACTCFFLVSSMKCKLIRGPGFAVPGNSIHKISLLAMLDICDLSTPLYSTCWMRHPKSFNNERIWFIVWSDEGPDDVEGTFSMLVTMLEMLWVGVLSRKESGCRGELNYCTTVETGNTRRDALISTSLTQR